MKTMLPPGIYYETSTMEITEHTFEDPAHFLMALIMVKDSASVIDFINTGKVTIDQALLYSKNTPEVHEYLSRYYKLTILNEK